ncbi:SEC14-like protein 2 isoform X1 [Liolophura sinensis]|uniref:SEC14-like protein 2 isoform X1 n=1 Tax=Liolophura sinensis TaxID=3198878 RepID=UPI003157F56D
MSGRVGDLSPKQVEALEKLREAVKDILTPSHDEHCLLRWLRAREFDVKKTETMMRNDVVWRQQVGADTIIEDWAVPEVVEKYYTGGLFGQDKEGALLWIDPFGHIDLKGICRSVKKRDIIKSKIHLLETIYRKFAQLTKEQGRQVDQIVIVFDLEKFGRRHLWKPGADLFCEMVELFEDHYPETQKTCFVINAPTIFPVVYNIVKPFLNEGTAKKVHVLGSNYKDVLKKYIDADQLPIHWGGTACDDNGDPKCSSKICFGGEVPESYYLKMQSSESLNFKEVLVKRGSTVQLDFDIKVAGSGLRWQFTTEGFDLGFGVYRRTENGVRQKAGDMEEVIPTQRVNSHMVPEDGFYTCTEPGVYVLRFDNTYSWARSKQVLYSVEVLVPDDTGATKVWKEVGQADAAIVNGTDT